MYQNHGNKKQSWHDWISISTWHRMWQASCFTSAYHYSIKARKSRPYFPSSSLIFTTLEFGTIRTKHNNQSCFSNASFHETLELQVNNGNGDTQKSRTLAQTLSPTSKKSETFSTLPAAIAEMCAKPSWKKTLSNVAQEVTCHRNQWKKWWVFPKSPLSL